MEQMDLFYEDAIDLAAEILRAHSATPEEFEAEMNRQAEILAQDRRQN